MPRGNPVGTLDVRWYVWSRARSKRERESEIEANKVCLAYLRPFHCHLLVPASKGNPMISGHSTSNTLQSTTYRTMDQWPDCGSLTLTIYRAPSEPDRIQKKKKSRYVVNWSAPPRLCKLQGRAADDCFLRSIDHLEIGLFLVSCSTGQLDQPPILTFFGCRPLEGIFTRPQST